MQPVNKPCFYFNICILDYSAQIVRTTQKLYTAGKPAHFTAQIAHI